jgi:hypothetical protein
VIGRLVSLAIVPARTGVELALVAPELVRALGRSVPALLEELPLLTRETCADWSSSSSASPRRTAS